MFQINKKISQDPSLEEQLALIIGCIDPLPNDLKSQNGKKHRFRRKKSYFKTLYQLYLLEKHSIKHKWESVFVSIDTIAYYSQKVGIKLSPSSIKNIINSDSFSIFCDIDRYFGDTNIYRFKKWAYDAFSFLEKVGMMKKYKENFDEWHKIFVKRFGSDRFVKALHESGSWKEVMNKLSTKRSLKMSGSPPLKMSTITSLPKREPDFMTPLGCRLNTKKEVSIPVYKEFAYLGQAIGSRFQVKEAEINSIMRRFSLSDMKGGFRIADEWKKQGMHMLNPERVLTAAIKKHQKTKNHGTYTV